MAQRKVSGTPGVVYLKRVEGRGVKEEKIEAEVTETSQRDSKKDPKSITAVRRSRRENMKNIAAKILKMLELSTPKLHGRCEGGWAKAVTETFLLHRASLVRVCKLYCRDGYYLKGGVKIKKKALPVGAEAPTGGQNLFKCSAACRCGVLYVERRSGPGNGKPSRLLTV